jgi:disulfide oxidoreductase YuzD
METKNVVKIRILDLPGANSGCACCGPSTCGPDFFSVKMKADELESALKEAYPEQTSTEYINLLAAVDEKGTEFGQLLVTKQQPSPLVIINGEAKYAGSIQVKRIVKDVGNILNS